MKSEFEIVREFSLKLGLENKTDGSLFIYRAKSGVASKPDGYYYFEGISFILDAKAEGKRFTGQLFDYMRLESNENFVGFKYNGEIFECYVKGELQKDEQVLQNAAYYRDKYFKNKTNNEIIVSKSAHRLANLFRDANVDKQMNVPFIGAAILCMRFGAKIDVTSTATILRSLTLGINETINEERSLSRKQKKDFIKLALQDETLRCCKDEDLFAIMSEISTIYNFINISVDDYKGHDIMNSFLKIFRHWNSINAKEKGEVFTPDHIAQLMYRLTFCGKENYILDPTCGSGTFLTNAMANMFCEAKSRDEKKEICETRLIGIEVNAFNATLAGINMMLHGDGAANIFRENCFEKLPKLKNCYDRVLMNPPFSQRDRELKFVLTALENMKTGGFLSTILPKSCVKGTDEKNVALLKEIFSFCSLRFSVSLPKTLFAPNAGADTCILTFEKTGKPHSCETLLVNLSDDGFLLKSETRIDASQKWEPIFAEVLNAALNGQFSHFRAVKQKLNFDDELLFEAFGSPRDFSVKKETFARYMRENIATKILCGKELNFSHSDVTFCHSDAPSRHSVRSRRRLRSEESNEKIFWQSPQSDKKDVQNFAKFKINDLLVKIEKGGTKSIDRKLEDKYDLSGLPLVIAKKDNNGIGGMTSDFAKVYADKFCIVAGGDGGGGKCYYCDFDFCATSFIMVCDLNKKFAAADRFAKFYLAVVISERLFGTVAHGRTIKEVPSIEVELPAKKDGSPDFLEMSNFTKTLQYAKFF